MSRAGRRGPMSPNSRLFFAAFLIAAGTLLFLGNLGLLPIREIWAFWPLLIVGFGVTRIIHLPTLSGKFVGLMMVFFGSVFLLISLGALHIRSHDRSWPISMLLIAGGMVMLIKVLDKHDPGAPIWGGFRGFRDFGPPVSSDPSQVSDFSIMGSIKRRIDARDFRGGHAIGLLSSIELDLRHAGVSELGEVVYLEVSAIMGSVKIRVPEQWRVRIQGASIMGNYEDKTIPPTSEVNAATLVITGFSFMSAIEVED
jgi:Domain of unknown function (DUF5668)/Cell wall-active antibiotics response 4TMS YvqF